jgi:hypothetical protein
MIRPDLTGWRAQYDRMMRGFDRLQRPYRQAVDYSDDLQHFFQDCWHLKDWIRNDLAAGCGTSIEAEVQRLMPLRVVADLANGSKHLALDSRKREGAYVTQTDVTVHIAQERPVEVVCRITLDDGTVLDATDVVRDAVSAWDSLLRRLQLIS